MSRVIVRGLPIYLTEEKLKDHFAKQGPVTDVKLMKKRNGESRRFAFIGYKSDEDANSAVKYFNMSYIDTARIEVETAKTFSDPLVPQSWRDKKRSAEERLKETEAKLQKLEDYQIQKQLKKQRKQENKNKLSNILDSKIENNPKLKEYLETLNSSTTVRKYGEDNGPTNEDLEKALDNLDDNNDVPGINRKKPEVAVIQSTASDDEYEDFNKGADEEFNGFDESNNNNEEEEEEEEKMISLNDLVSNKEEKEVDDDDNDEVKVNENVSDLDWFKMRRTRMKESDSEETTEKQKEQETKETKEIEQIEQIDEAMVEEEGEEEEPEPELTAEDKAIQQISQTGRLFIRNILYSAKESDFSNLFSKYGDLEEVHIAVDTRTGQSKGFVYIKFINSKDAVNAYLNLDKQIFQGRLLHILPGQEKKDHKLDEFDLANLPLKKQRELKKKYEASKSQFSWNSLYMSNDAILESVASGLGINKSDLINPESSNSAVKQALAEAHVITNVRQFFEERGVDLTSFNKKTEKDDRIILIKNFQHGTTQEELGELFAAHGELKRILMPPAGTIAIVEFRDAPSGRAAFNKLAFRRLGKSILYLEKGPQGLFISDEVKNSSIIDDINNGNNVKGKEVKISSTDLLDINKESEGIEDDDNNNSNNSFVSGPTVSIFVKNLNFITTSKDLTEVFKPLDGFMVATVKTKPDTKNPGKTLSMGFGFVEFKTKEQANLAISTMDGHVIDGHKIQLKISNRVSQSSNSSSSSSSSSSQQSKKKSKKSPKIIIKNLPFESTRKDVFELFGSFGTLKSVRVPKKFNKSARGFAFVEFSSLKEAESAMDQLQGVHLLGRRLVLDYAELQSDNVEDEISKMINKAKTQSNTRKLADLRENYRGKRKLELDDDEESNEFSLNK